MCEEQQQQQQQHQEHTRQLSAAATAQIFTFTANIVDTASANIGPPAAPSNAVILLLLSDLILSETVSISILWKESWDRLKEMAIASSREKINVSKIAVLFFVLPLSLLMLALLVTAAMIHHCLLLLLGTTPIHGWMYLPPVLILLMGVMPLFMFFVSIDMFYIHTALTLTLTLALTITITITLTLTLNVTKLN